MKRERNWRKRAREKVGEKRDIRREDERIAGMLMRRGGRTEGRMVEWEIREETGRRLRGN